MGPECIAMQMRNKRAGEGYALTRRVATRLLDFATPNGTFVRFLVFFRVIVNALSHVPVMRYPEQFTRR